MKKERTIQRISFAEKLPNKLAPPPGYTVFIKDGTFYIPPHNGYTYDGADVLHYRKPKPPNDFIINNNNKKAKRR